VGARLAAKPVATPELQTHRSLLGRRPRETTIQGGPPKPAAKTPRSCQNAGPRGPARKASGARRPRARATATQTPDQPPESQPAGSQLSPQTAAVHPEPAATSLFLDWSAAGSSGVCFGGKTSERSDRKVSRNARLVQSDSRNKPHLHGTGHDVVPALPRGDWEIDWITLAQLIGLRQGKVSPSHLFSRDVLHTLPQSDFENLFLRSPSAADHSLAFHTKGNSDSGAWTGHPRHRPSLVADLGVTAAPRRYRKA